MSYRGGKFFRSGGKMLHPTVMGDGNSDDDDSSSDEDDVVVERKKADSGSSNNDKRSSGASDEDSDDDGGANNEGDGDDDDDKDDDGDRGSKKRRRDSSGAGGDKKKSKSAKSARNAFFDEEAEASDDDEDDGDGEAYGTHHDPDDIVRRHYTEEDIRKEQMDEEAEELIRLQDRRRAQAGGRDLSEVDVAEVAREIEERHRMQRSRVDRSVLDGGPGGIGGAEDYGAVAQQSLVPSVSDPSLFMISCSTGKEEELVYQIMNKCAAYARQGRPLGITGAVAAQSKGRIYVEAYEEPAVIEATEGIRNLMHYTRTKIPINDMTTVMSVTPSKKPVKKNDWVRMTRGHYKGDLALVRAVRDSGLKCIIQCVPRLDLTLSELPPEEAKLRRRTVRPPQKFFNAQEIAALGKVLNRQRFPGLDNLFCDYFESNFYNDGYMLKEVTVGTMVKPCGDDDPPTLDELQRFRKRKKADAENYDDDEEEENEGSKIAGSLLDELSELQGKTGLGAKGSGGSGLIIGDTIEVIEGDLVGLRGKILSLDGATVKVKPSNEADLGETTEVEFLANQVRKFIAIGAHVKVTDGRYANETGVVVAVEELEGDTDCVAVVLTDMTHKEISVRTSQLQESAEIASGQDKLAGYELHDLVVLSGGGTTNEVGVIVRVGREEFTVVNNHGIVREVRPEELRGKRNAGSNRAVALDVQGNQIRVGDTVSVAEGPHKGKTATIKRMSRAQLFLYSQTKTENAGIFVVRSRSCVLAGAGAQSRAAAGSGGESPFATPQSQHGGKTSGGPAARGRRDDGLIGKTVRIQAGQWKGYLGTVSDATATHVQVELHSRLKKVMVVRERVAVVGDKFGATEDPDRTTANNVALGAATPFLGGATPMHGGATPMHGGATPMHGGATPMHDGGGDDVWRPGGAIDATPMHEGSMDSDSNALGSDSWGATPSTQQADPFSGPTSADSGGWGSSNDQGGSTWTPATDGGSSAFDGNASNTDSYTPGGSGAALDNTAAMGEGDAAEEAPVWYMERVCVQTKGGDKAGVIKEINANNTAIVELEDKSTTTVRHGDLDMAAPKEHDMVLVLGGTDVGVEGELVCIDGSDAILKDANEEFKIVDFVHLAKIEAES